MVLARVAQAVQADRGGAGHRRIRGRHIAGCATDLSDRIIEAQREEIARMQEMLER